MADFETSLAARKTQFWCVRPINLIDSKVPKTLPEGGFTGATEARYGIGDEEKTTVGRVTAGIGQFAVHVEGARRSAEDYDVPDAFGTDKLRDSFADSTQGLFFWVSGGDHGGQIGCDSMGRLLAHAVRGVSSGVPRTSLGAAPIFFPCVGMAPTVPSLQ